MSNNEPKSPAVGAGPDASPGGAELMSVIWDAMYAFCEVTRRCLLPVIATMLIVWILYVPQSTEFFAGMLLVCASQPQHCIGGYAVRATDVQFLAFWIVLFCFSGSVWYLARALIHHRKPVRHMRKRYTRGIEIWLPRLLGATPLYVAALILLGPLAETDTIVHWITLPELAASLAYVTFWLVLPFLLHHRFPVQFSRSKMWIGFSVGIASILVCTLNAGSQDSGWWLALPLGSTTICYMVFASQFKGPVYRRILAVLATELFCALAYMTIFKATIASTKATQWTWTLSLTMILPAAFLLLVMFRRRAGWQRKGRQFHRKFELDMGLTAFLKRWVSHLPPRVVLPWALALLLCLSISILAGQNAETAASILTGPASLVLWLQLLFLLAFGLFFVIPLVLRFMLVIMLVSLIFFPSVPVMRIGPDQTLPGDLCNVRAGLCSPDEVVRAQFDAWQGLRGGDKDERPVIFVASAGGGSRAAVHTATMLSTVDNATCGEFGDRIFAISAVSGGALGAASYVASRADLKRTSEMRDACWHHAPGKTRPDRTSLGLFTMTVQDHLSPTLIRWLFRDLPLSLVPESFRSNDTEYDSTSRAGTLRASWANAYGNFLLKEGWKSDGANALTADRRMNAGTVDGSGPYLLLNATSAQDGRRTVLSKPLFCPLDGYCGADPGSLLDDAIDSARFPLISPANNRDVYGWNPWQGNRFVTKRSLVDGGYADNSGLVTLSEVVNALVDDNRINAKRIYVIIITSNPEEGITPAHMPNYADIGLLAQLQAPLNTVLAARDSRLDGIVQSLQTRLGASQIIYWPMTELTKNKLSPKEIDRLAATHPPEVVAKNRLNLRDSVGSHRGHPAPLGWALSQEAAEWANEFAKTANHSYANPSDDHPYYFEQKLIQDLNSPLNSAAVPVSVN